MKITCPTCSTSYGLPDGSVSPRGRDVRCARCGTKWRVAGSAAARAPEAAEEPEAHLALAGPDGADARPSETALAATEAFPAPEAESVWDDAPPDEPAEDSLDAPLGAPVIDATPRGFGDRRKATRRKKRPRPGKSRFDGQWPGVAALAAVLGVVVAGVAFREPLVRAEPDLAGLYSFIGLDVNLRGLEIIEVVTFRETGGSSSGLVVEGTVLNVTDSVREVPALRVSIRSAAGDELLATIIQPAATTLAQGDTLRFRATLPAPAPEAVDVAVRFVDRAEPS